ncbi:tyrosine-type recombinase/integrase [Acidocella sp. MX-AZ03]|uniref:tyrosine-type recombinase/integrase n=1 Tax=Acidocella sp. MX-AZ03 TaxID=2697363 RepID=UPI003FA4B846
MPERDRRQSPRKYWHYRRAARPHALRHAAAQHLLDQGISMKVIGDFLGHRDPSSTAIYAKVNLAALREVAALDLEGLA